VKAIVCGASVTVKLRLAVAAPYALFAATEAWMVQVPIFSIVAVFVPEFTEHTVGVVDI
jgi:hypothetical protein